MGEEIRSNKLLFVEPFDEIKKMDDELYELFINHLPIDDFKKKYGIEYIYLKESDYQRIIDLFTMDNNNAFYDIISNRSDISMRLNNRIRELFFYIDGVEVKAMKLTDIFQNIREIFPEICNEKRYGKCYDLAYILVQSIPFDGDLVTGYHYGYTEKSKYLHSWIETKLNNEDYVFDATINAAINKDGYYKIKHIKEDEIVQRIKKNTIIKDKELYGEYFDAMNLKVPPYNTFRDELIGDIEKIKNKK